MIKLLAHILLVAENHIGFMDRLKYLWNIIIHLAPVVIVLDTVNWWFKENQQFGLFICIALIVNMGVGIIMHIKNKTFSVEEFLVKNILMGFVIVVVYVMLEMLRYTAGANIAGEVFRVLIQTVTLLYPTSKVAKNIFILTKGEYPPEFIMKRLYNFEKNGDLSKLFGDFKSE